MHWRLSSAAGWMLTGRYMPVCAIVALRVPDCAARRGFERAMGRAFADPGHCARIAAIWAVGAALRGWRPFADQASWTHSL